MNREINPLLALGIIILFILPVAILFWAGGEHANARVGVLYLNSDSQGQLSVQADHLLVTQISGEEEEEVVDLSLLGATEVMGNVAYFSNNDFLVRSGGADWGPGAYLSSGSLRDPELEKLRLEITADISDLAKLFRCNRKASRCEPFHNIEAPWRYRLFIDSKSDDVYVTDVTNHKINKYNKDGELLGVLEHGLKFPKKIRRYVNSLHDSYEKQDEHYYVTDTNNHRLLFFSGRNENFGTQMSEIKTAPHDHQGAHWTKDSILFSDHWWILNSHNGMQDTQLIRLDLKGNFVDEITFPQDAELYDFLVHNNNLLVSDLASGTIYQFDKHGARIVDINFYLIDEYFKQVKSENDYFQGIMVFTQSILAIMVLGGIVLAIKVARDHNKTHPVPKHLRVDVPLYLIDKPSGDIMKNMLISNIEIVPGKRVTQHLGLVQGSTVRAKHAGKDIMAGLKNIFGGELNSYTELLQESRQEAVDRMSEQAKAIGANAVVNVRFATSAITAGASEILAYGTAVVIEDL